jgi:hypothetical protein
MAEKKQDKKISDKLKAEEQEKLMMLAKADEVKGEQLVISVDGTIQTEEELKKFALAGIDDPEKKYDLYYKGVMRLLRKHLPKGQSNKKARDYTYEEKNTYLTRGHRKNEQGIRGADSRMTYITDAEEFLDIIVKWVFEKGTMVDLFTKLRDLNVSKGYGAPKAS